MQKSTFARGERIEWLQIRNAGCLAGSQFHFQLLDQKNLSVTPPAYPAYGLISKLYITRQRLVQDVRSGFSQSL